jgi:ribulose-phosphate 3-epimerase
MGAGFSRVVGKSGVALDSSSLQISPSIFAADLGQITREVQAAEAAGADRIHVDVMDGRFVPNITFGPIILRAIRKATSLPLDVHLMIVEPERYVADFAQAGADELLVHIEATNHLPRTLDHIRSLGKRAGVVLNPQTPPESLAYALEHLDAILVMSVNPGFSGQAFMRECLPKLRAVRKMIDQTGRPISLSVDGGVGPGTARQVVEAGARVLVAGSSVFEKSNYRDAIAAIRADGAAGLERASAT